jgi:hypothetical protein
MKMRGRKATAFIVINFLIAAIFGLVCWRVPDSLTTTTICTAMGIIFLNGALFIGGNSLDKVLRMKGFTGLGSGPNAG